MEIMELKNTIAQIKSSVDGINRAEERVTQKIEIIQSEEQRENRLKN